MIKFTQAMNVKVLIAGLLIVSTFTARAQEDYAFKVLVNKGQNSMKSGGAWEPLKVGLRLKEVDEVKLSPNSYVGLMHVSGKSLELKGEGVHKVANLATRIKERETSVVNKYAEFLLSSDEGRKNTMAATGSVTRGFNNVTLLLPQNSTYVFSDSLSVGWISSDDVSGPYVVTLRSLFDQVLKTFETSDTVLTLNLKDETLVGESDFSITVHPKSNEGRISSRVALRKFSPNDKQRVLADYSEIAPAVAGNTALNHWILARFFEERKLLADAASSLQRAIQLAPDVGDYREDYQAFLLRNGLQPRPQK